MIGHGEKLTRKHEQAIAALLSAPSIPAAAKVVGVGEATLWRWLQLPDFQTAYRDARRRVFEMALVQLQADASVAVRVLREVAEDTEVSASVRVAASRTIIETAIRGVELIDLQERVSRLESLLEDQKQEKAKDRKWA